MPGCVPAGTTSSSSPSSVASVNLVPSAAWAMDTGSSVIEVVALADEPLVRGDPDVHVQVAGRAAPRTDRAAAGEPQRGTRVDAGGDVDLVGLLGDGAPVAVARRARAGDHLAGAVAPRAHRRR